LKWSKVSQEIAKESAQEGESQEEKAKKAKRSQINEGQRGWGDANSPSRNFLIRRGFTPLTNSHQPPSYSLQMAECDFEICSCFRARIFVR